MKKSIRVLSVFMAVMLMLTSLPVCNIFASAVLIEAGNSDTENGLVIDVKPGKSSYAYSDTAEIKVTVTNEYGFTVENATVCLYSEQAKLPKGEKCVSDMMTIGDSESKTVQFHAKLGDSKKLNFIQKILFFFRNLFSSSDSFRRITADEKNRISLNENNGIFENYKEFTLNFGSADCQFDVFVFYDYGFTTDMQEKCVEKVDKEIKDTIESDGFLADANDDLDLDEEGNVINATADKQKETIRTTLENLSDRGLIQNAEFDEDNNTYWFDYVYGDETATGGVCFERQSDDTNSAGPTVNMPQATDKAGGNKPYTVIEGFGRSNNYTLDDILKKFFGASLHNAEYEACRNLEGVTFLCFACHGKMYSRIFSMDSQPAIVIEMSNDEKAQADILTGAIKSIFIITDYQKDIAQGKIKAEIATQKLLLLPAFIKDRSLDNTVVFLECCEAFGKGSRNNELAQSFLDAGAKAVIGFKEKVDSVYSKNFMDAFYKYFYTGITVQEAFDKCKKDFGENDGNGATPQLLGDGNATILECGPSGSKTGIRLKFVDDEGNETLSNMIIVEIGTTLQKSDVLGFAEDCVGGWDHYYVEETVDYPITVGAEPIIIPIDVVND